MSVVIVITEKSYRELLQQNKVHSRTHDSRRPKVRADERNPPPPHLSRIAKVCPIREHRQSFARKAMAERGESTKVDGPEPAAEQGQSASRDAFIRWHAPFSPFAVQ
jgi:hypothetical protein